MNDVHALSGAYAVDAVDDIERAHFERHLNECAECRHEVDSLRAGAAMLAELAPVGPSPALRSRILAEVATVRPLPPHVVEVRPRRRRFPAL
ncbi:MAG: RskA family anti-sigma factor, partial [Nocardioides sp.]